MSAVNKFRFCNYEMLEYMKSKTDKFGTFGIWVPPCSGNFVGFACRNRIEAVRVCHIDKASVKSSTCRGHLATENGVRIMQHLL